MRKDERRMPNDERARPASARATVAKPGMITREPSRTVIGFHVLPKGPRIRFQDFPGHTLRRQYVIIGTAKNCDVRLRDETVSAHHCAIIRRRSRVDVQDMNSTNGVWIAGCRVHSCELYAGTIITVGNTHIAAIGEEAADRNLVIAAPTLRDYLRKAFDLYGTIRAAAAGIGLPYSTLRGWLRKKWSRPRG